MTATAPPGERRLWWARAVTPKTTRGLAWAGAVTGVLAAALAIVLRDRDTPTRLDRAVSRMLGVEGLVYDVLPGTGAVTRSGLMTAPGSAPGIAVLLALILGAGLVWRDGRAIVYTVATLGCVGGLVQFVLKPAVDRTRYGFISFPSMHCAGVTALGIAAVILIHRRYPSRRVLMASIAAAGTLVLVVSLGVVRRHFHEPTDVAGGIAVGASVALLSAAAAFGPWFSRRSAR
jgi:membrane-associated phospholipid phosphatase